MKYMYWIIVLAILGGGLGASVYFGSKTPNVALIEYIQVEQPEELGQMIADKLKKEVAASQVLFVGVTPDAIEDVELVRGFITALASSLETPVVFQVLGVEQNLPYVELLESNLRLDLKSEESRLVEGLQRAQIEGLRVLIVMPTIYATQTLSKNLAARVKALGIQPMSLSISKYPLTAQQAETFDPVCAVEVGDIKGTGGLGCAIRDLSQKAFGKQQEANKYSGLMNKVGESDYLVLFNRNEIFR